MESAPINLQAPLARRRALLARLMQQAQANPGAVGRVGAFRGPAGGGRSSFNQVDLAAAPLPSINLGFRPGGPIPGGFQGDPNSPLTQFPGLGQDEWNPHLPDAPGAAPGGSGEGAAAPPYQGDPADYQQAQWTPPPPPVTYSPTAPPPTYGGPLRNLIGVSGAPAGLAPQPQQTAPAPLAPLPAPQQSLLQPAPLPPDPWDVFRRLGGSGQSAATGTRGTFRM